MSSISRYHRDSAYFSRLLNLNRNVAAKTTRERALLSLLGEVPRGVDILDAGCGLGGFSEVLRASNRVTGVDINEQCLRHVAARLGYATQCFDLEEPWPFPPASFDLVLFGDVLEHLFATAEVLQQAKRTLRTGGRIVVAVPNVGYWRRRIRLLIHGELTGDLDEHIRFFSPRSLTRVCEMAGLQILRYRPYAWSSSPNRALPIGLAWGFVALVVPR